MRVVVGSTNPVKLEAVRSALARVFPAAGHEVEAVGAASGVSDQPRGEAETRRGALGRVASAARLRPDADAWIGIEGGVAEEIAAAADAGRDGPRSEDEPPALQAFARVAVRVGDRVGESASGRFRLPEPVAALVREGVELGEADDRVFGREDSKRQEGAVGLLTGGAVTRTELYAQAVCLALCRFVHPELYGGDGGDGTP